MGRVSQNYLWSNYKQHLLSRFDPLPFISAESMILFKKKKVPQADRTESHPDHWSHTSLFWVLSQLGVQLRLCLPPLTQRGAHFIPLLRKHQQPHKFYVKNSYMALATGMYLSLSLDRALDILDYKESQVLKNWCVWTVVLEKTLESHLDCKEIKSVHPKGNQSWVFIGRTGAEAETPILWPPHAESWLIGKDPDAGKDWRQEKGTTEEEMFGWHHQLNGHEFEQALGDGDGQESLACCSPWGRKESDTTEWLNWTEPNHIFVCSMWPWAYTVRPLHTNLKVANFQRCKVHLHVRSLKLVHVSVMHCLTHASSTSGLAFMHFTMLYRGLPWWLRW